MSTDHTKGRLVAHFPDGKCVDLSGWRADYDESMGATQYQAIQDEACEVVAIVVARSDDNWGKLDTDCNARRLAACWNACISLTTEQVEQIDGLLPAKLNYQTMQRDRETLLAALRDIATHSDAYGLRAKAALEKVGVTP